jgi:hypothetical protein
MRIMAKSFLPALWLCLLGAGCTTTSITNLTPRQQPRNPNGLYPIEAALTSRQQTLRWQDIQPNVMVETDFFPMRPTPLMTNRWETLIPVAPGTNVVYYRFKFDYDATGFGKNHPDSKLSTLYRLQISDK